MGTSCVVSVTIVRFTSDMALRYIHLQPYIATASNTPNLQGGVWSKVPYILIVTMQTNNYHITYYIRRYHMW